MTAYTLPSIGATGTFELRYPLDSLPVLNEIYSCLAIRKLSDYFANNEDPKALVYQAYNLSMDEYADHVRKDMPIVSLQSDNGHWIYVPASYILSYPGINGVPYRSMMIGISLPSIPMNKDLSYIETDLSNIIVDSLGVTPTVKSVETSRPVMVSTEKHEQTQLSRSLLSKNRLTDSSKYAKLLVDFEASVQKVQILEDYITGNEFNNGTKIYKPRILMPANKSKNISSFANFVSSDFKSREILDIHVSTDWQVATDTAFVNIVAESMGDLDNRTTWYTDIFEVSKTYYARVRYKASVTGNSIWSSTVGFSTKSNFIPNVEKSRLSPGDRRPNDHFGHSISVDHSGKRVAITSLRGNTGTILDTGAVHIFYNSETGWIQEAKLTPSDGRTNDNFGYAVSINKDGSKIVVGSPNHDPFDVFNAGVAYIYTRLDNSWVEEAKLVPSDMNANNYFGSAVAISDSGNRVAIGAHRRDNILVVNTGGVYTYLKDETDEWIEESILVTSDGRDYDNFGYSLSMTGDGTRLAIGSRFQDGSSIVNIGAVYIFSRLGDEWAEEAKITASDKALFDMFGYSVDITSDGSRVVIGAYLAEDGVITDAGIVYVFTRNGVEWTQEARLTSGKRKKKDRLGCSVSIDDNGKRIVAGAYLADINEAVDSGAAYIFLRTHDTWTLSNELVPVDSSANSQFGWSVAISGDGDNIHIGSIKANSLGVMDSGASYMFG